MHKAHSPFANTRILTDITDHLRYIHQQYDHDTYVKMMLRHVLDSVRHRHSHKGKYKEGETRKHRRLTNIKKKADKIAEPQNNTDLAGGPDTDTEVDLCKLDRKRAYFQDECKEYCHL